MSIPFFSDIDLKNNKIINAKNPENNGDLVNKYYLDNIINNTQSTLNNNILIAKEEMTTYVDTQIETINTNMITNVTQILLDNIIDNITSLDNSKALSANMGHYLSTLIDDTNNLITTLSETINIYSDTATEIGRFESGTINSQVYRVIHTLEIGPQSSQEIQIDLSEKIPINCNIINIYGTYNLAENTYFMQYGIDTTATNGVFINNFNNDLKQLNIYVGSDTITELENNTLLFIIEYYNNVAIL